MTRKYSVTLLTKLLAIFSVLNTITKVSKNLSPFYKTLLLCPSIFLSLKHKLNKNLSNTQTFSFLCTEDYKK